MAKHQATNVLDAPTTTTAPEDTTSLVVADKTAIAVIEPDYEEDAGDGLAPSKFPRFGLAFRGQHCNQFVAKCFRFGCRTLGQLRRIIEADM